MYHKYFSKEDFDCAVQFINFKARQLIGKYGFTKHDLKDLQQDMIADLLQRVPKYNPEQSPKEYYIKQIVNNCVAAIIAKQKAGIRDFRKLAFSFNDKIKDEEGNDIERCETISKEDTVDINGLHPPPEDMKLHSYIDINRAIENLPDCLQILAKSIMKYDSITELSNETGMPRWKVYEEIERIRKLFSKAGLKIYL